jgi:uncharacterized phage protein (TIGR01671 family)
MFDVAAIDWNEDDTINLVKSQSALNYDHDEGGYWAFPRHDIELMQFTGLLDKNGKEIYEGDIVKYARLGYRKNQIGKIRWVDCCFVVVTDLWLRRGLALEQKELIALQGGFETEVIGNVWENPMLLTQKESTAPAE